MISPTRLPHIIAAVVALLMSTATFAQPTNKGLDKYDFFYSGENFNDRRIFLVRDGHVAFQYKESEDSNGVPGEISDAILMNDNHVLVAGQYSVMELELNPNNLKAAPKVVWRHNWTRPDYEVHSIQPIGRKYVVYVQCGNSPNASIGDRFPYNENYPTKLIVREIKSWKIIRELDIPYNGCKRHNLNRSCRLTPWGTFIFASMEQDDAIEIDSNGKVVKRTHMNGLWGVEVLPNGNLLLTGNNEAAEFDRNGNKVWNYKWGDDPNIKNDPAYLGNNTGKFHLDVQKAYRLPDGVTVINNWGGWGDDTFDNNHQPIQFRAVDQNKNVVWELQSWNGSDYLGPSTMFQLLDCPVNRDALYFGDIRDNDEVKPTKSKQFLIYNVGLQKYLQTDDEGNISFVDSEEEATPQEIIKNVSGKYSIVAPKFTGGWGVMGGNFVRPANNGVWMDEVWGTTLTQGWTFTETNDEGKDYLYITYTWAGYAKGTGRVSPTPDGKTYALYYGDYALRKTGMTTAQKKQLEAPGVYGDLSSNLSEHGDYAKWRIIPVSTGKIDIVSEVVSLKSLKHDTADSWYTLNGMEIKKPSTSGLYIHQGRKVFVKK